MISTKLRRPLLAVAAVMSSALILSACGSSDDDKPADETTTQTEETETPEETEAPETDTPAPSAEQKEVTIGESIDDPDMKDKVEIVSAVRDFPSTEKADVIADGGEIVLVQIKVAPGDQYGGLIQGGNFKISWNDGGDWWADKRRMVEADMEAAGFEPFEDVSRRDGGEHTGWLAFIVEEKADTYSLRYERMGAKVIGQDKTIDELVKEFTIPAA